MNPRYICPHCHASVDPATMDAGRSESSELRFCPACDRPVVYSVIPRAGDTGQLPCLAQQPKQALAA